MAKHHTFRLNDMCAIVPKRGVHGPQQGEHVIIVGRHPELNEYTVHYKDGLYGWFQAEDLTLVLHDAHAQLELWEDAYNERCKLAREQDDAMIEDVLDELSVKLDRIEAGHCSECDKKLDSDEGDDESMCLSCRVNDDAEGEYKYHVVDPRMRVLFKTNQEDAARTYAANTTKLCKIKCVGEDDKWL